MGQLIHLLKAFLLFVAMILIGGFLMLLALVMWGNPRLNRLFLQSFGWSTRKIVGIKQIVLNEPRIRSRRPAVLIANHQSGLDLAILGSICPTRSVIVAKKEIQYIPLFGWFFKGAGNILINRSKTEDAKRMINAVKEALTQKNLNMVIFPEGTRNRHGAGDDLMLPFKKGAFYLAVSTQLPLIPVVCSSLKGKAVWENFDLGGGVVVLSVLEPIETKDLAPHEVDAFRTRVRELMVAELKRVNALADEYTQNLKEKICAPSCHS